jgi:hypothetical protein
VPQVIHELERWQEPVPQGSMRVVVLDVASRLREIPSQLRASKVPDSLSVYVLLESLSLARLGAVFFTASKEVLD